MLKNPWALRQVLLVNRFANIVLLMQIYCKFILVEYSMQTIAECCEGDGQCEYCTIGWSDFEKKKWTLVVLCPIVLLYFQIPKIQFLVLPLSWGRASANLNCYRKVNYFFKRFFKSPPCFVTSVMSFSSSTSIFLDVQQMNNCKNLLHFRWNLWHKPRPLILSFIFRNIFCKLSFEKIIYSNNPCICFKI